MHLQPGGDTGSRAWLPALGVCLGALVALLASDLGAWDVTGVKSAGTALVCCAILGAATAVIGCWRHLLVLDVVLLGLYAVIALSPVVRPLMDIWVRSDALPPRFDAVVVLSEGVNSSGTLTTGGTERLMSAIELARQRPGTRLITTRIASNGVTSDLDQRRLIGMAGLSQVWSVVDTVRTTRDEANRVAAHLLPRGLHTAAVMTSPAHTRRACAAFTKAGLTVYCVPTRERQFDTLHPRTASDRVAAFRALVYEWLGFVKYRSRRWV